MKRAALPIFLAALCGCAGVGEVRTLGRYDFSYRIEGDARAAPLQIFDDGKQTFMQFREITPAIFGVDREGKPVVLTARRDGQYVVAERIEREFVFLLDQDQARATGKYIGNHNRAILPHELAALRAPEPAQAATPDLGITSRRVPFSAGSARIGEETRSSLEELLPRAIAAKRIVILAKPAHEGDRRLGATRAIALRDWFARRGVRRDRILIVTGIALAPDYSEVMLGPAESARKSSMHMVRLTEPRKPAIYSAARPMKVSAPAQPVFVDRGGFGTTDVGLIRR